MRRRQVRLTSDILDGILRRGGVRLDFPLVPSERAQLAHYLGRRWLRRYEPEICAIVQLGRRCRYEALEQEYEQVMASVLRPAVGKLMRKGAQLVEDFGTVLMDVFAPALDTLRRGFEHLGAELLKLTAVVEPLHPKNLANPLTDVQLLTVTVQRRLGRNFMFVTGVKVYGASGEYVQPGTGEWVRRSEDLHHSAHRPGVRKGMWATSLRRGAKPPRRKRRRPASYPR